MSYGVKPGSLTEGAPLIVEDLDLSGMGAYTDEQKEAILKAGGVDDFFVGDGLLSGYWQRKSDEGVKWRIFDDTEIKLHKEIVDASRTDTGDKK